jgi:cobalt-zinc-cadmium resistance protein CzcA
MTDNFIAFFYRERLLVAVCSMLIVAGGILALRRLNVDAFPDVTPVQVEIDTDAQGLAPQEVEQLITFPIENEMNGISGVTRVESESKFGLSVVTVFFGDDRHLLRAPAGFRRLSRKDHIPRDSDHDGSHHHRNRPNLPLPNRRPGKAIRNCAPFRTGLSS